jgi:hypothetical protein
MPNVTIYGKTSGGDYKPLLVDTDGTLQTSGSGGGGGTTAISGTVPTTIQSGTVNVAGTVPVSVSGTPTIKAVRASTATVSTVAGTTASGTILASNANRLGAALYNDSTAPLYLVVGTAAASSTSFSIAVAGSAYFELPFNYTGVLMGAWAANAGSARVTEFA